MQELSLIEIPESVQEKDYNDALRYLRARTIKFPLSSLLKLYLQSNKSDTYCEYFRGFRLLVGFLSPIDASNAISLSVPPMLISYGANEIATILGISITKIYGALVEIHYGRTTAELLQFIEQS